MEYLGRTPAPPLDRFIERIWYCSDASPRGPSPSWAPHGPVRERVLPGGGTVDLIVNLVEDDIAIYDATDPTVVRARAGALVGGTHTRSFLVDPRQRSSVVGVHFRPGGAFPFLGISPVEIVDAHVELEDLWGSGGTDLREQLALARSAEERFDILEVALLRKLRRARAGHPAVHGAVGALRAAERGVRVGDVASASGLSHRRFVELFEREVGLTPKLYARLQRFHHVKRRVAVLGEPPSWAEFALACGYFDQSHMIRDFVAFAGISPAKYLENRADETRLDNVVHAYPLNHPALRQV